MNRYDRHILLDLIGQEGQEKIRKAHVAVIGCGGLGAIAASYLAGAGVGTLTIIDGDSPDLTNLHRQVFYNLESNDTKSEQLSSYLSQFNPDVRVNTVSKYLAKNDIKESLAGADIVLECTDHIWTKYMVNDYCHMNHIPMIYASLHKYDGYLSTFLNRNYNDIHLRDIFPEPDDRIPNCSEVGVLNTIAGIMGLMQANEALKWITGIKDLVHNQLLVYNVVTNEQTKLKLRKTWKGDIIKTWSDNHYTMNNYCEIPEIEVEKLFQEPENYHIISILNGDNHVAITPDTSHIQASEFNIYEWEPEEERTTVIYCTSGKVSLQLALQLKEEFPDHEILSLKGGIKAVRKYQKESMDVH